MRLLHKVYDLVLRLWFFIFDQLLLYRIMRQLSPTYNIQFMNLGYWPTETSLKDDKQIKELIEKNSAETDLDRPHYFLYERALSQHRNYPDFDGIQLLEVGCGQGYGIKWIEKTHPRLNSVRGVDRCAPKGSCVISGDAHHLPFGSNQFDLVLSVESSHLYADCEQFFRECSRILREGGYLCWIDLRYRTEVADTRKQAVRAGLFEERWDDVTDNVLQGILRTSTRYDQILKKTTRIVRLFSSSLRATYCAPGTHTHAKFTSGEKGYYVALWRNQ